MSGGGEATVEQGAKHPMLTTAELHPVDARRRWIRMMDRCEVQWWQVAGTSADALHALEATARAHTWLHSPCDLDSTTGWLFSVHPDTTSAIQAAVDAAAGVSVSSSGRSSAAPATSSSSSPSPSPSSSPSSSSSSAMALSLGFLAATAHCVTPTDFSDLRWGWYGGQLVVGVLPPPPTPPQPAGPSPASVMWQAMVSTSALHRHHSRTNHRDSSSPLWGIPHSPNRSPRLSPRLSPLGGPRKRSRSLSLDLTPPTPPLLPPASIDRKLLPPPVPAYAATAVTDRSKAAAVGGAAAAKTGATAMGSLRARGGVAAVAPTTAAPGPSLLMSPTQLHKSSAAAPASAHPPTPPAFAQPRPGSGGRWGGSKRPPTPPRGMFSAFVTGSNVAGAGAGAGAGAAATADGATGARVEAASCAVAGDATDAAAPCDGHSATGIGGNGTAATSKPHAPPPPLRAPPPRDPTPPASLPVAPGSVAELQGWRRTAAVLAVHDTSRRCMQCTADCPVVTCQPWWASAAMGPSVAEPRAATVPRHVLQRLDQAFKLWFPAWEPQPDRHVTVAQGRPRPPLPHLLARYTGKLVTALPALLPSWEALSLQPVSLAPKHVTYHVTHDFLHHLSEVYSSRLRFGSHLPASVDMLAAVDCDLVFVSERPATATPTTAAGRGPAARGYGAASNTPTLPSDAVTRARVFRALTALRTAACALCHRVAVGQPAPVPVATSTPGATAFHPITHAPPSSLSVPCRVAYVVNPFPAVAIGWPGGLDSLARGVFRGGPPQPVPLSACVHLAVQSLVRCGLFDAVHLLPAHDIVSSGVGIGASNHLRHHAWNVYTHSLAGSAMCASPTVGVPCNHSGSDPAPGGGAQPGFPVPPKPATSKQFRCRFEMVPGVDVATQCRVAPPVVGCRHPTPPVCLRHPTLPTLCVAFRVLPDDAGVLVCVAPASGECVSAGAFPLRFVTSPGGDKEASSGATSPVATDAVVAATLLHAISQLRRQLPDSTQRLHHAIVVASVATVTPALAAAVAHAAHASWGAQSTGAAADGGPLSFTVAALDCRWLRANDTAASPAAQVHLLCGRHALGVRPVVTTASGLCAQLQCVAVRDATAASWVDIASQCGVEALEWVVAVLTSLAVVDSDVRCGHAANGGVPLFVQRCMQHL